ncbi:hypothetical protein ANN_13166 [Periplaneta americana]|uniref:Reverse transcriptase domain-containing protein n=1 Tax=Periplaneta americana TaxID=6978 RepID=A0ABQ8TIT3_PERAM|nr:hypothetical protein ANN_13166 [Periplaneta americana]
MRHEWNISQIERPIENITWLDLRPQIPSSVEKEGSAEPCDSIDNVYMEVVSGGRSYKFNSEVPQNDLKNFDAFIDEGNEEEQGKQREECVCLLSLTDSKSTATSRKRTQDPQKEKFRLITHKFHLSVNGQRIPACKGCFIKTFEETNKFITLALINRNVEIQQKINIHHAESDNAKIRNWRRQTVYYAATPLICNSVYQAVTKKKKRWFDEDCYMEVERRKQPKLKFLQDPVEANRDNNYFNKRREANRTLRNKKRDYSKEKLNEVETNSKNKNIGYLYKGLKEFKNGYQARVNVIKDENRDLLADSHSILNRWKNYFRQLLNIHRLNRNDRDETEIQTAGPFIPEPTLSEVEIAIENQKNYKSPGIDQIPAELIQEGESALSNEIYKLVLAILEKEIVPEQWKESIIVPIFKKGDKTNCSNFRGISLLLTSYKILSNILLRRLTPYVDEIIGDHQCGFRRNTSTIDQIFYIRQIMEKKMGV